MIDPSGLMMIEPRSSAASEPLIDDLTRKMAAAWRRRLDASEVYRGFHICACGAWSDNRDHWIDGRLTNSLCVHYLAYHRGDVSSAELDKVRALPGDGELPTAKDLCVPPRRVGGDN